MNNQHISLHNRHNFRMIKHCQEVKADYRIFHLTKDKRIIYRRIRNNKFFSNCHQVLKSLAKCKTSREVIRNNNNKCQCFSNNSIYTYSNNNSNSNNSINSNNFKITCFLKITRNKKSANL